MNASSMFLVVISVACVIRHALEMAFLTSKTTSNSEVASRCGTHDRGEVVFMHGLSLATYLMAIAAFVMGSPQIGFPAIGMTFLTDGIVTTWCPPFKK
jgi:hypothetical protein